MLVQGYKLLHDVIHKKGTFGYPTVIDRTLETGLTSIEETDMPQYKAPLRDMQFVLHELLNAEEHYAKLPAFQENVSRELVDQYLEAAADFCENELSPLNQIGDREGCTWNDGVVTTPTGFKEAYQKYIEWAFRL